MDKKNIIKNILHKEAPEWDKSLVWQNIEQQIQPKKKRRPVFIFLFLMVISLVIVWSVMKTLKTPTSLIESNPINDVLVTQKHVNKIDDRSIDSRLSAKEDSTLIIQKENDITENTSILASKSSSPLFKPFYNDDPMIENKSQNPSVRKNWINDLIEADKIDLGNTLQENLLDTSQNISLISAVLKKDDITDQYEEPSLPTLNFKSISSNNINNVSVNQKHQQSINHNTFPQWHLSFSSSYAAVRRKISHSDPLTLNYSNTQEQHVTSNEALSATWMVSRKAFKNIYFSAGVRYLQINEFLVADDVIINSGIQQNDQAYVLNNISGNTYLSGERAYTRRQGFSIKSPNKYQRINIPIGISSMNSLMGRDITFGIGMDFNVYQRYSGINMGLDNKFIYKEADKFSEIYRKNWVNSWFVHFNVDILKYNDFRVFVGGHYASDIGSTLQTRWAIHQNYSRYGLELGLKYFWE